MNTHPDTIPSSSPSASDPKGIILQALADYDAVEAACPLNGPRHLRPKHDEDCPTCGANSSQTCWRSSLAAHGFVRKVRAALADGSNATTNGNSGLNEND